MSGEDSEIIAYCSLYCGDCFNHKGEIADLAKDLRKKLREEKFDCVSQGLSKYFKQFKDYEQCYQVLGATGKATAPGQNKESGEAANGKAIGRDHASGQNK